MVVIHSSRFDMTMVEQKNEYSVAAIYCNLFITARTEKTNSGVTTGTTIPRGDRSSLLTNEDDPVTLTSSSYSQQDQSPNEPDFWTEDFWTTSDEEQAEKKLQRHIEKCAISFKLLTSNPRDDADVDQDEDARAWNQFYSQHGTRFFKDRHYLEKAFPEEFLPPLMDEGASETYGKTLVEIGCGVGNAILPLLAASTDPTKQSSGGNMWRFIHGLDISDKAIQLLRQDARFIAFNQQEGMTYDDNSTYSAEVSSQIGRAVFGHVCDISDTIPSSCVGISDVTTMLFCLSAVDPASMLLAAKHIASTLKPGGRLVVRDYGRYDEAQMKLGASRQKRLKDNFYRKHDGTKCFYFRLEDLEALFCNSDTGLEVLELKYLRRVYQNKAMGQKRRRVWVQGRFRKPFDTGDDNGCTGTASECGLKY